MVFSYCKKRNICEAFLLASVSKSLWAFIFVFSSISRLDINFSKGGKVEPFTPDKSISGKA